MVFDWSELGCGVPSPDDPNVEIRKDFLIPFLTLNVKPRPLYFYYETFATLGMKAGDIVYVNENEIGPGKPVPLDIEVTSLRFKEPIHVFKFMKYCEAMLQYASVHSVIANLDFFVRGIVYPVNG